MITNVRAVLSAAARVLRAFTPRKPRRRLIPTIGDELRGGALAFEARQLTSFVELGFNPINGHNRAVIRWDDPDYQAFAIAASFFGWGGLSAQSGFSPVWDNDRVLAKEVAETTVVHPYVGGADVLTLAAEHTHLDSVINSSDDWYSFHMFTTYASSFVWGQNQYTVTDDPNGVDETFTIDLRATLSPAAAAGFGREYTTLTKVEFGGYEVSMSSTFMNASVTYFSNVPGQAIDLTVSGDLQSSFMLVDVPMEDGDSFPITVTFASSLITWPVGFEAGAVAVNSTQMSWDINLSTHA